MVDKPILKKDRPPEDKESKPSVDKDRARGRGKGKGKGKGRRNKDERDKKPPVNPALMRGPKPTQKVEPEPEPEVNEEGVAEEIAAEAVEAEASTDGEDPAAE